MTTPLFQSGLHIGFGRLVAGKRETAPLSEEKSLESPMAGLIEFPLIEFV